MPKLLNKIFPKNVRELIEEDLYWKGVGYLKTVYNMKDFIKTDNDEFTIYFDRENSSMDDPRYEYVCYMQFIDRLGVEVATLRFSELFAFRLVDFIYDFAAGPDETASIMIESAERDMSHYVLELDKQEGKSGTLISLKLDKYYYLYNYYMNIVSTTLTGVDTIYSIGEAMYFSYLIDIDNGDKYHEVISENGIRYEKYY